MPDKHQYPPLAIGFPFAGDQIGGSSVSGLNLASTLLRRGHRVTAIIHGEGPMRQRAREAGLDVVAAPEISRVATALRRQKFRWGQLASAPKLVRISSRLGLDIVHVNDLAMLRTWAVPAKLSGAAMVSHWRSNIARSLSVRIALRLSTAIIAIARYNRDQLPKWAQAKTTLEYNPLGPEMSEAGRIAARAAIREQLGLPPGARLIGTFGSHTVRKRTHVLADVLNAIPQDAAGASVFGLASGKYDEPYDTELDAKIETFGLKDRLLRPGWVQPVEDWIAACDVVLAPAEREPFGRSFFDGVQAGAPVVMSSDSGAKELIRDGETGYVVNPYELNRWIEVVRTILDHPKAAASMVAAARASLIDFSPERHADRVEQVYRRALAG